MHGDFILHTSNVSKRTLEKEGGRVYVYRKLIFLFFSVIGLHVCLIVEKTR